MTENNLYKQQPIKSENKEEIKFKHLIIPDNLKFIKPFAKKVLTDKDLKELEQETFKLPEDFKEFLSYYSGFYLGSRYETLVYFCLPKQYKDVFKYNNFTGLYAYKNKSIEEGDCSQLYFWQLPEHLREELEEEIKDEPKKRLYFASIFGVAGQFFICPEGCIYWIDIYRRKHDKPIKLADSTNDFLKLLIHWTQFLEYYKNLYPEDTQEHERIAKWVEKTRKAEAKKKREDAKFKK